MGNVDKKIKKNNQDVKIELIQQDTLNVVNKFLGKEGILIATTENSFEDMLNTYLLTLQHQIIQAYNNGNLIIYLGNIGPEMIVSDNNLMALELPSYHGIEIFIDFTHDNVFLVAKYKLDHLKIAPLVKEIHYVVKEYIWI